MRCLARRIRVTRRGSTAPATSARLVLTVGGFAPPKNLLICSPHALELVAFCQRRLETDPIRTLDLINEKMSRGDVNGKAAIRGRDFLLDNWVDGRVRRFVGVSARVGGWYSASADASLRNSWFFGVASIVEEMSALCGAHSEASHQVQALRRERGVGNAASPISGEVRLIVILQGSRLYHL